jgi:hypothetical protein
MWQLVNLCPLGLAHPSCLLLGHDLSECGGTGEGCTFSIVSYVCSGRIHDVKGVGATLTGGSDVRDP